MGVYLHAKFEVCSIILTGFRQGVILSPPPSPQNKPLKRPPRLGLRKHYTSSLIFLITQENYLIIFECIDKENLRKIFDLDLKIFGLYLDCDLGIQLI